MAYNIKDVFYLSTTAFVTKAIAGGGSAQLDLSAYIDPITTRSRKGTGLAIYKIHYSVTNSDKTNIVAPDDGEAGILNVSMQAGLGIGDLATGSISTSADAEGPRVDNALLVGGMNYYSPTSYPGAMAEAQVYCEPSTEVPYVIVRDNVCLVYNVDSAKTFVDDVRVAVRMECAQITLDQATLNQLLRTQTV